MKKLSGLAVLTILIGLCFSFVQQTKIKPPKKNIENLVFVSANSNNILLIEGKNIPSTSFIINKTLSTVCKVSFEGSGSGIIVGRRGSVHFVITNYHVIANAPTVTNGSWLKGVLDDCGVVIELFNEKAELWFSTPAGVLASDEEKDLAILAILSPNINLPVAELLSLDEWKYVKILTEVYAIGCPLGFPPHATDGIVSSFYDGLWVSSPIFFGNSGGGVFLKITGKLIGLTHAIPGYYGILLPHMAKVVSLPVIYDFLKEKQLDWILK